MIRAATLPIADCRLPIADCRLPIADCRLPIADCRLPIADCRLPIAADAVVSNSRRFSSRFFGSFRAFLRFSVCALFILKTAVGMNREPREKKGGRTDLPDLKHFTWLGSDAFAQSVLLSRISYFAVSTSAFWIHWNIPASSDSRVFFNAINSPFDSDP